MAHRVIERLVARRGRRVPVDDGCRIALVLYGGGMAGVRGGGAMIALEELGLSHAFDDIVAVSAGVANASYLLADATRLGTSIYYEDLVGRQFIHPWRFWRVVDIASLIDVMKRTKPLDIDRVLTSRTRLHVALWDVDHHRRAFLEVHEGTADEFVATLHAAMSLAYLNPGSVTIRGTRYLDRWLETSRDLTSLIDTALAREATDVLVIYNRAYQRRRAADDPRILEIFPPLPGLSRFERNPDRLKAAAQAMGRVVKRTFGIEADINLSPIR